MSSFITDICAMPKQRSPSSPPVTVIVRHQVDPGKDEIFRNWMQGITDACKSFPGYLGTEVARSGDAEHPERLCIFRFDDYPHLEAWLGSDERGQWLTRATEFSSAPADVRQYEGIDFWFTPKPVTASPKHKMALVTFAVIWPLVHFIPRAVSAVVATPTLAHEALSVLLIVLLMTYAVMPLTTRFLAPWLFKPTAL